MVASRRIARPTTAPRHAQKPRGCLQPCPEPDCDGVTDATTTRGTMTHRKCRRCGKSHKHPNGNHVFAKS